MKNLLVVLLLTVSAFAADAQSCYEQSKKIAKENTASEWPATFRNHFDGKTCWLELTTPTNDITYPVITFGDAFEEQPLGVVWNSSKDPLGADNCTFKGKQCHSVYEFKELVQPYLTK